MNKGEIAYRSSEIYSITQRLKNEFMSHSLSISFLLVIIVLFGDGRWVNGFFLAFLSNIPSRPVQSPFKLRNLFQLGQQQQLQQLKQPHNN